MLADPQTLGEQSSSSIFTREVAVEQLEDAVMTPFEPQGPVPSKTAVRSVQLGISENWVIKKSMLVVQAVSRRQLLVVTQLSPAYPCTFSA